MRSSPEIQLEEDFKTLVCILSATPASVLNGLRADIFKLDPNYVGNEEKYKVIKADVRRPWARPTMSQD